MSELTLLTCTRNGSRVLTEVLAAYAQQRFTRPVDFDVLIIDNGSTDRTADIARQAILKYSLNGEVLSEPKPGKINAFLRGLHAARGELISIIDDDNIIGSEFISRTVDWFQRMPQVGMVGSHNRYVGDARPDWFDNTRGPYACAVPMLNGLVIDDDDGCRVGKWGVIAGAGSTFRREPVVNSLREGFEFFNDTRRDSRMSITGEDLELCWLLHSLGFWFVSDPRITVEHHIDANRLSWTYARKLCRSIGAGSLAADAFISSAPSVRSKKYGRLRCNWQWQLVSRVLRMLRNWRACVLASTGTHVGKREILNAEASFGAVMRIVLTRERYTKYMKRLATAEWAQKRVD